MKTYQAPRGTKDIFGEEAARFAYVKKVFSDLAVFYGYGEIVTPVFEETALFERTIGGSSDIVTKQMYTFPDKAGRSLTLRPEGTAGVVRAAVENGILRPLPKKFFYSGPMFRYEKPQKDRRRQFFQVGAEYFGEQAPSADAEVIEMCAETLSKLGIKYTLKINSIGCSSCRGEYEKKLLLFAESRKEQLCSDCKDRMKTNPLRILDCKNPECKIVLKDAPLLSESLCGDCAENFSQIKKFLSNMNISFEEDSSLVRGLDYYNGCVFEFYAEGARDAVAAGGRYDGLVKFLGGADVPAAGFAIGVDRILSLTDFSQGRKDYMIVSPGAVSSELFSLAGKIRASGKICAVSAKPKLKNALKEASSGAFRFAVIMGEDEIKNMTVTIRDLDSSEQKTIPKKEFLEKL
ncbi:MAG: histidine--tRNA ligase [Elusimicrobiota bacterium]|nr:histidine--tRNA ligase [Elusimicrobiota bacterium]